MNRRLRLFYISVNVTFLMVLDIDPASPVDPCGGPFCASPESECTGISVSGGLASGLPLIGAEVCRDPSKSVNFGDGCATLEYFGEVDCQEMIPVTPSPISNISYGLIGDYNGTIEWDRSCNGHLASKTKLYNFSVVEIATLGFPCCVKDGQLARNHADVTFNNSTGTSSLDNTTFIPSSLSTSWWPPGSPYSASFPPPAAAVKSVNVTASCGADSVAATATVVNEDVAVSVNPLSLDFGGLFDLIKNSVNTGVCKSKTPGLPTGAITLSFHKLCCKQTSGCNINDAEDLSGDLTFPIAGVDCHFPVFGVPIVASLDVVISASATVGLSIDLKQDCSGGDLCGSASLNVTIGGGVGFTVAAGAVSGSLTLQIGGSGSATWCRVAGGTAKVNFQQTKIVGTITFISFITHSVDYVIAPGFTTPVYTWGT